MSDTTSKGVIDTSNFLLTSLTTWCTNVMKTIPYSPETGTALIYTLLRLATVCSLADTTRDLSVEEARRRSDLLYDRVVTALCNELDAFRDRPS